MVTGSTPPERGSTALYGQWLDSCLQCGIPAISGDTAARIMATVYLCSNNENFTHNVKLRLDIDYICRRWHIQGGSMPDPGLSDLIRRYSGEIEAFIAQRDNDAGKRLGRGNLPYPQWCCDLIEQRYGFKLFQ